MICYQTRRTPKSLVKDQKIYISHPPVTFLRPFLKSYDFCLHQKTLKTCWQCSRPMPRVAADEKIVLVLAESSHLHQLLLLLHVRPAKELGSEHLGAHSAQPAQSQSTPWHQAAHPRVFPRTLQCPDKSFQSRLFEPFEHRAGDRSSFSVVVITRLKPPQPFHQSAASRSENEHG